MRQELFGFDDLDGGFWMMDTQTGNNAWFALFAQMKKIKKDLKKKDKSDAFGRLYGVLLFATEDDTFIWDNEVCTLYGNSIVVIKITNTVLAITTAIITTHWEFTRNGTRRSSSPGSQTTARPGGRSLKRLIRTSALPWREEKTGVTGPRFSCHFQCFLCLKI